MTNDDVFYPPKSKEGEYIYPGDIVYDSKGGQFTVEKIIYGERGPIVEVLGQSEFDDFSYQSFVMSFAAIRNYSKKKERTLDDVLSAARDVCENAPGTFADKAILHSVVSACIHEAYDIGKVER